MEERKEGRKKKGRDIKSRCISKPDQKGPHNSKQWRSEWQKHTQKHNPKSHLVHLSSWDIKNMKLTLGRSAEKHVIVTRLKAATVDLCSQGYTTQTRPCLGVPKANGTIGGRRDDEVVRLRPIEICPERGWNKQCMKKSISVCTTVYLQI